MFIVEKDGSVKINLAERGEHKVLWETAFTFLKSRMKLSKFRHCKTTSANKCVCSGERYRVTSMQLQVVKMFGSVMKFCHLIKTVTRRCNQLTAWTLRNLCFDTITHATKWQRTSPAKHRARVTAKDKRILTNAHTFAQVGQQSQVCGRYTYSVYDQLVPAHEEQALVCGRVISRASSVLDISVKKAPSHSKTLLDSRQLTVNGFLKCQDRF